MINTVSTSTNNNVVVVTAPGPSGPIGPAGPIGEPGTIATNSGTIVSPYLIVNGTATITGSLIVSGSGTFYNIGPAQFSGSTGMLGNLTVNGTSSATVFSGSGALLTNIPASGITGLNLSRIADSTVSASVSTGATAFTLNTGGTTLFTVNNSGLGTFTNGLTVNGAVANLNAGLNVSGSNTVINSPSIQLIGSATLNGQPITTAGDLTLDRIKSGAVTASVSTGATAFTVETGGTDLFTVSNAGLASGSFEGSGAGLTGIPASGIVGLNLSQISSGSVSASISPDNGFEVNTNSIINGYLETTDYLATDNVLYTNNIEENLTNGGIAFVAGGFGYKFNNNVEVTGSINATSFTGSGAGLTDIPASGITGLNLSRTATGSVTASVNIGNTPFTIESGSSTLMNVTSAGRIAVSKSINVGVPTSNQWQESLEGSYFNTFNSTSDVSEVLRFVAGLLSASAPTPTPNTKTYDNIQENKSGTNTSAIISGYVPQSTTDANITYLTDKNFAAAGTTLFPGKTLYSNSSYAINYSSVAGESTTVSSSADAQLFGLGPLTSGGPTQFNVSGTINWFYSDNNSKTTTATSQSENLLSIGSFGTSNGLTLAKINTANPAVIPAAFQDGKFAGVYSSGLYNNGRSFSSVSSSGWYQISASIAISSGSSPYSALKSATEEIFWAPVSAINSAIGNNTPTFTGGGNVAQTAVSRSLSGAPYLRQATWTISASVSGLFNPLYAASSTLADFNEADAFVILSGSTAVSTAGGTIQTSNAVYDSTGITVRSTASIPFETDIVKLTGSATFNAGTADNINQIGLGTTSYSLTTRARNNAGSQSTLNTQAIDYFTDGTFAQPAASGTMGYYGQAQGYDPGSLTGGSETFFGEDFRMQITDNLLVGSQAGGDSWDTSYGTDNLGDLDLQVKPGFLVKPGGTYGYWLPDRSSENYRFYARAFQRSTAGSAGRLTLTVTTAATAQNWTATGSLAGDGIGISILMQSAGTGVLGTARLLDVTDTFSSVIRTGVPTDNSSNPFSPNIDLYGNSGGSFTDEGSTLTAVVPIRNADGFFLNGTYPNLIVILRYKGDISPVSNISISYS